jgi:hypothetical protein
VLYFFFVLPRWFELTGAWTPSLGRPVRIVDGLLIGLAALPVVFTLARTRKPEFGTPQLALSLRFWSIVLHVLAGVLIVGAAVAEIWLSLDRSGQWLFGIYGAAAAMAVLGALGFYLAFVAEMPPPPPKPIKLKSKTTRRSRKTSEDEAASEDAHAADETVEADETEAEAPEVDDTVEAAESEQEAAAPTADAPASVDDESSSDETEGKLRNRRPGGKTASRFRRKSGGVALDE